MRTAQIAQILIAAASHSSLVPVAWRSVRASFECACLLASACLVQGSCQIAKSELK
jgi:hypothetical protein